MIRSLYPEITQRVQDAIAREGRFMLPDLALIEHVIDLVDSELEALTTLGAAFEHEPHDATPIGPSAVVPAPVVSGVVVTADAVVVQPGGSVIAGAGSIALSPVAAPVASTDETVHDSPQG